jgi:hypothetical protein
MKHCWLALIFLSFFVKEKFCVPQIVYRPAVWADEMEESEETEVNDDFLEFVQKEDLKHQTDEVLERKDDYDLDTLESTISSSVLSLENRKNRDKQGKDCPEN